MRSTLIGPLNEEPLILVGYDLALKRGRAGEPEDQCQTTDHEAKHTRHKTTAKPENARIVSHR